MAKTATETKTKRATKTAKEAPKEKKTKRAPSAYNLYMKEHLKKYREEHPGVAQKDCMKAVGAMWRDAPENPRRGEEPKAKATKETKKAAPKAKASKAEEEAATSDAEEPASDE